jgi:hypothetical protein
LHKVVSEVTELLALLIDAHRDRKKKRNGVAFINHADSFNGEIYSTNATILAARLRQLLQ